MEVNGRFNSSVILLPGVEPLVYQSGRRLGRHQNPSARFGDEKNLSSLAENRTTIPLFTASSPVTIPNELYQHPTLTVCECIFFLGGGGYKIYLACTLLCKKLAVPRKIAHCRKYSSAEQHRVTLPSPSWTIGVLSGMKTVMIQR